MKWSSTQVAWKPWELTVLHTVCGNPTSKQYEVLLTPIIESRLPTELWLEWARDCSGHESDLDWLLKWLQKEIRVLERSEMYKVEGKSEDIIKSSSKTKK